MRQQHELARAYELSRKGKHDKAERLCRRLLRQYPKDAPATHLLGLINKNAGKDADAERFMRKSLQLDPRSAEYHANLANLLSRSGQLEEAIQKYRDALTLDATSKPAGIGLVTALNKLGRHTDAEIEARLLTKRLPLDPEVCLIVLINRRSVRARPHIPPSPQVRRVAQIYRHRSIERNQ